MSSILTQRDETPADPTTSTIATVVRRTFTRRRKVVPYTDPVAGTGLQVRPTENVYEIIVIDHADDRALVPIRNIHPLPAARRRPGRRIMAMSAAAAAMCAGVGFGAGLMLSEVPAPRPPAAPPALSSVRSWFASMG